MHRDELPKVIALKTSAPAQNKIMHLAKLLTCPGRASNLPSPTGRFGVARSRGAHEGCRLVFVRSIELCASCALPRNTYQDSSPVPSRLAQHILRAVQCSLDVFWYIDSGCLQRTGNKQFAEVDATQDSRDVKRCAPIGIARVNEIEGSNSRTRHRYSGQGTVTRAARSCWKRGQS